jgi:PAS domain S-box-containing protein
MASKPDLTATEREHDVGLRALADQLPTILWITDAELRFTFSSGGGLATLGLTREQILGMPLHACIDSHDENHPAIAAHRGALDGSSTRFDMQWRDRWFEMYVAPFRQGGAIVGAAGMALDISARKRDEEQSIAYQTRLREKYKLEAVGQLASGLAHEINNPLQSVLNFAQLIRARCEPGSLREYATEILNEVQRIATSVRNLQSFVRQDGELPVEIRMHELVERTLSLFRAAMEKEQIALEVAVPAELPAVWGKLHAIQQVFVNLLTAARDALNERHPAGHERKRIGVSARVVAAAAGERALRLTIEDHGTVIGIEDLARVFEPFVTIEGRGQGSGVALAISHHIVRESGGTLSVETEGELTRFHLDLPLAAEH